MAMAMGRPMNDVVVVAGIRIPLRRWEPTDRAFIAVTWGLGDRAAGGAPEAVHREWHPKVVDRLLDTNGAVVACSERVPSTIYGWACGSERVLHYAHVVPELRGHGLGRALIAAATGGHDRIEVTHRWVRPPSWVTFNPYRLMVGQ